METVTISLEEYLALKESQDKLCALESMGVDNWEGYEDAMREFYSNEDS